MNHTLPTLLDAGLIGGLVEGCSSALRPADDGSAGDVSTVETSRDAAADAADGVPPCVRGERPAYPPGPYAIAAQTTLPDMRFVADDGRAVTLGAYHDPCASTPRLLVVRTFAAWSGPSRWYAEHTGALRARPDASRLVVLDLLALVATSLPAAVRGSASRTGRSPAATSGCASRVAPRTPTAARRRGTSARSGDRSRRRCSAPTRTVFALPVNCVTTTTPYPMGFTCRGNVAGTAGTCIPRWRRSEALSRSAREVDTMAATASPAEDSLSLPLEDVTP